jgi:hypothetical protein
MQRLQSYSVMIDLDGHSKVIIFNNAECIDTLVKSPWGTDLTQNAIEKKQ